MRTNRRLTPFHRLTACLPLCAGLALAACGTSKSTVPPPGETDDAGDTGDLAIDEGDMATTTPPKGDMAMAQGKGDMAMPLGGMPQCKTLTLSPADAVVLVDGVHTFSVSYKALCGAFDVSGFAAWTVDDAMLGAFKANVFTSGAGSAGASMVHATYDDGMGNKVSAQTSLTLKVTTVVIAPGTPMNAPNQFGGNPNANLAPKWVYPSDGTLIPPNLGLLELQFMPTGNNLFEIGFTGNGVNLKVYTSCNALNGGCTYTPDDPVWTLLSAQSRGKTITITLRGTAGTDVGTAAPIKLSFADEDMTGGLYYWAASLGGIYRYDFGLRGQKGEAFYTPLQAGAMCVGCHAMSRDGSKMAAGLNIPGPSTMQILDVASKKVLYQLGNGLGIGAGSNYQAFTSDGSKIVTTETGGLTLRNGTTGALMGANPQVSNANMPDIAPDDSAVVFSRGDPTCTIICQTLSSLNAGIFTVPLANNQFGQVTQLVPINKGNETNYYPSFSPDGKYVVFNRAAKDSYDQMDARVMIVPSAGGKVIDLTSLNAGGANSWPKWAPYSHHLAGSPIFWVTLSTRRGYGLHGGTNSQIWMVALDASKLANGVDAAYPAFWLPFQDNGTGNHIAQWATRVVRQPCSITHAQACPQGLICVNDQCVPPGP